MSYLPTNRNYRLACKVTARRFFPNTVNLDDHLQPATRSGAPTIPIAISLRGGHDGLPHACSRTDTRKEVCRPRQSVVLYYQLSPSCDRVHADTGPEQYRSLLRKLDDISKSLRQLCDRFDFKKTALAKRVPRSEALERRGEARSGGYHRIGNQPGGTLGIGFIGLAECLIALKGKHHGAESQALGSASWDICAAV